jgi:hypothetical protein
VAVGGSKKAAKTVGRYVDPASRGRITKKRQVTVEERVEGWLGWVVVDLLIFGVALIVMNYLSALPGAASPWYLLGGLVSLFVAFGLATKWR